MNGIFMGRKPMKSSKMINPFSVVNEMQKRSLISSQTAEVSCFICDEVVNGKGIPLLMTCTSYSNTQLPAKIGQLMGDGFMVIVAITDILCKRCFFLINQLDKLESDITEVKNALIEFLNVKYHLKDINGNSNNDSFDSHPDFEVSDAPLDNRFMTNIIVGDILSSSSVKCNSIASQCIKMELCETDDHGNIVDVKRSNEDSSKTNDIDNSLILMEMEREIVTADKCSAINEMNEFTEDSVCNVSQYECKSCTFSTSTLDVLVSHLKLHSEKDSLKCSECCEKFEIQADFDQHVDRVHAELPLKQLDGKVENNHDCPSKKKVFECSVCKYRHCNKIILDAHMHQHVKTEKLSCNICRKVFKHKITLRKHMSSHLNFKCDLCLASFQNKISLIHHLKKHNPENTNSNVQVTNDVNLIIVNSPKNPRCNIAVNCENNCEENNTDIDKIDDKTTKYDQVEILLERIHSDDPKENYSSLANFVVDENVDCQQTENVCDMGITEKSSHLFDEVNNLETKAVYEAPFLETDFKEQSVDKVTDKLMNNIVKMQKCVQVGKVNRIESNDSEVSCILDSDNQNFEGAECYIKDVENNELKNSDKSQMDADLKQVGLLKKVYVCSLCSLRTTSESHIKRHLKCHIALERKTYKCQICERVLTTHSNLKRHISLHENCEGGVVECNMCNERLRDRLHLKHHMEIRHPESYQCSFCDQRFENKKICHEHELLHPAFQCDVCKKKFLTEGRLKSHKIFTHRVSGQSFSKTKIFKCHICLKILTTHHNLKRHLQNHEKYSGAVKCVLCNEELTDKLHLRQHVEEKHPENYQCTFCHKVFSNRKTCKAHEITHSERFVYKCESCEKLFLTEARLKRHQGIMHRDPHCRVCGKEIAHPLKLLDHERRHERFKTMFPCNQCPKVFRTPSGLKYHSSIHTGKYAVYCEICGKGLHSEVVLEEHMATHTKEVRYTCEVCGRTFSSNSTYRLHRLWHDNPLPYKCDICDRKFKHTSILAVHKRRAHTGERPYKCPHCSQTFSVSSTLNKHVILHTKEYPYRCEQCDKGFTTRTKMAKHMAKLHNDYEMLKKKTCEYKMALHPSELSSSVKDVNEEPYMVVDQILQDEKGRVEEVEEETHSATVQVLENVAVDSAQEAIFTIFQQDFSKF